MRLRVLVVTFLLLVAARATAQTQIPPPSNPIAFCFNQPAPAADTWELVFDGGAPEPLAMVPASTPGPTTAFCQSKGATFTHSFSIPATRFPPRPAPYVVTVRSLNAIGATVGVPYEVTVGLKPGQGSITAAGQLPE